MYIYIYAHYIHNNTLCVYAYVCKRISHDIHTHAHMGYKPSTMCVMNIPSEKAMSKIDIR